MTCFYAYIHVDKKIFVVLSTVDSTSGTDWLRALMDHFTRSAAVSTDSSGMETGVGADANSSLVTFISARVIHKVVPPQKSLLIVSK
jgi:hypothetical protein